MGSMWNWRIRIEGGQTRLEPLALPPEIMTLDQASLELPGGSYTTFRTYQGCCALQLGAHLQRLEESARLVGRFERIQAEQIRSALRQAIAQAQAETSRQQELRFRLTLDLEAAPGEVLISAEKLHTPLPEEYQEGVRVETSRLRRERPAAKLTGFIAQASAARLALPTGIHEALMVDEGGCILEGLGSNFFAVRQGKILTAGEGVLPGITRSQALESAQRLGIEVVYEAVVVSELAVISEAFITSSSRGVLPVVQVDQMVIGTGKPGEVTLRITDEFEQQIQKKLEPI